MAAHLGDVEAIHFTTSDGLRLEGELAVPEDPAGTVLLCHPHPEQGGSMRSLVTSELFRALPAHDVAVLRFNFRGVEGSEGSHGGGVDERLDIEAALDRLVERSSTVPLVLAGWSFGADVSLTVLDPRLGGWFLVAPPLRVLPDDAFVAASDPRPKVVVVPENDQFNPPSSATARTAGWTNSRLEVIAGADHFLAGRTAKAAELLLAFLDDLSA